MKELILLGTGNAMVTKCFNTCFAIRQDDEYFLVDAGGGNGILAQLEKADIDMCHIHHMFVTHAHTDHVLGVVWVVRKIATLINKGKYTGKFHIYCHDVAKNVIETIAKMTLKKKDLAQIGKNILFHEVTDGQQAEILSMHVIFFDILSTKAKQFGFCAFRPRCPYACERCGEGGAPALRPVGEHEHMAACHLDMEVNDLG